MRKLVAEQRVRKSPAGGVDEESSNRRQPKAKNQCLLPPRTARHARRFVPFSYLAETLTAARRAAGAADLRETVWSWERQGGEMRW